MYNYDEMFKYAKEYLENSGGEACTIGKFPFRKRSEHINRVFMWVERLIDGQANINKEAVKVAAIFHDIGYGLALDDSEHAEISAVVCEQYLKKNGYNSEFVDFVTYLVRNHSSKELMTIKDTTLELILLMEADLLDETGALSVVWDCMMEGSQQVQSFYKTYEHILKYSYKAINANPMVTAKSKKFWQNKQNLMKEFIEQLQFDLGLNKKINFDYELGIQKPNDGEVNIIHRRAVRAVIIKENSILMVHTNKGDYKFPGGGVSSEESDEEALKREVIEETGFIISNVKEKIGIVTERRPDAFLDNSIFEMISCYYLCEVSNTKTNQQLDDYEAELDYQPVWISIDEAINSNETILKNDSADTNSWVHRENIVLKELK